MKLSAAIVALMAAAAFAASGFAKDPDLPPHVALNAVRHVIVVRHAYAECGDLQCGLNEEGYRQADELARLLSAVKDQNVRVRGVYASSACRTILTATPTANAAELPVEAYPARDGYPACEYLGDGDGLVRPTPDKQPQQGLSAAEPPAISRAALMSVLKGAAHDGDGEAPAYLVADHSNFVCAWFKDFGVPAEDFPADCGEEGLAHTDFADIYWMYQEDGKERAQWRLVHYENAFDRGVPNAYEQ